ncbi:hypothetical protein [Shewanella pealeana]|uniref:hypothetical protein n=1 Tax=Shewanella pealeana TaxID=70864 RepID=UPI0012319A71
MRELLKRQLNSLVTNSVLSLKFPQCSKSYRDNFSPFRIGITLCHVIEYLSLQETCSLIDMSQLHSACVQALNRILCWNLDYEEQGYV